MKRGGNFLNKSGLKIISALRSKLIFKKMFEARLEEGVIFKKIVDAIKDLVKNVNLDSNGSGISLQVVVVRGWWLVFREGDGFFSCGFGGIGVEREGFLEVPVRSELDNGSEHREPQQDPQVRRERWCNLGFFFYMIDNHAQDPGGGTNNTLVHLWVEEYFVNLHYLFQEGDRTSEF